MELNSHIKNNKNMKAKLVKESLNENIFKRKKIKEPYFDYFLEHDLAQAYEDGYVMKMEGYANPRNPQDIKKKESIYFIPLKEKNHFKIINLDTNMVLSDNFKFACNDDYSNLQLVIAGWSGPYTPTTVG